MFKASFSAVYVKASGHGCVNSESSALHYVSDMLAAYGPLIDHPNQSYYCANRKHFQCEINLAAGFVVCWRQKLESESLMNIFRFSYHPVCDAVALS